MTPAVRWAAGLGASALVHVAGAGVLLVALTPEPVPVQPTPTSRLDVQAMALDRETAQQAEPRPGTARESDASGAAINPGAVPMSRSEPLVPALSKTTAQVAPAIATPAAPPPSETLAPATTPVAQTQANAPLAEPATLTAPAPARAAPAVPAARPIPATAIIGSALSDASPQLQAASAAPARPELAPTVLPRPDRARAQPAQTVVVAALAPPSPSAPLVNAPSTEAAPATPQLAALSDTRIASAPVATAEAAVVVTSAATPQGARVTATLAFPAADGEVDPLSLAAFQSFVQPGEATAQGDPLRDGVAALLAAVPCSRLQVSFDPETASLLVKGHIPEPGLRQPVLDALRAQMGADIAVSDSLRLLPRPQCGALAGIASVGLPQSTDQTTNPLLIGKDTHARALDFVRDDRLWFDITGTDYPAFIYVDFFDAGGNVIHLAPNPQVPLAELAPKSAYRVGARQDGDVGLTLLVGPPYGQEIAVAFAASAPLYDGLRPMVEPAGPYIDWLRERVRDTRASDPAFKGEWVYFFVSTSEG